MAKILVADDNKDILSSIAVLLQESEPAHEFIFTDSLANMLTILEKEHVDICITDILFIGEGALDIYGLVMRFPAVKFVVISAYTEQLDVSQLERNGVIIITKPFAFSAITNAINKLLYKNVH